MEPKTVVVVEDEPAVMSLLCMVLREQGYEVMTAGNGKDGIDRVLEEKPDLVLMDVLLPGVQGGEAIRYLKGQPGLENTKVVLMSSLRPEDFDRIFANRSGADAYLQKPFSTEDVLRAVETLLSPA